MSPSLRAIFPENMTRRDYVVMALLFVFLVSIPPKWSGVPVVGILLVGLLLTANRAEWSAPSLRAYAFYTMLWMVPVIAATIGQHLIQVETATPWDELVKLILRMLGVGLGILLLLERRWISLSQLTFLVLVALSLHAVAGIGEWLVHPASSVENWRIVRVQGDTGSPNSLAAFMALSIVLCAGLIIPTWRNALLWAGLILSILCILATGSRGGMLAMAAGLFVLVPPNSRRRLFIYLLFALIVGISYAVSDWRELNLYTDSVRLDAIAHGIRAIELSPFIGSGVDSFTSISGFDITHSPHNALIDLAISSGLIAALGWVVSFSLMAYRLVLCRGPDARIILALLVVALVYGNLEASLIMSNQFRGIWLLVTTIACLVLARDATRCDDDLPSSERPDARE